jgi:hypothetical protein
VRILPLQTVHPADDHPVIAWVQHYRSNFTSAGEEPT